MPPKQMTTDGKSQTTKIDLRYVHRLGRTGRAGKEGRGVLLLHPFETFFLKQLGDLPLRDGAKEMAAALAAAGGAQADAKLARFSPLYSGLLWLFFSVFDHGLCARVFVCSCGTTGSCVQSPSRLLPSRQKKHQKSNQQRRNAHARAHSIPATHTDTQAAAVRRVDPDTSAKCYQAWLGFYNSHMKLLKWRKEELVANANLLALNVLGLDSPPPLLAMVRTAEAFRALLFCL